MFQIVLPSLAHRIDDIEELVRDFVAEFNGRRTERIDKIPDEVWEQLRRYDWPGNVRELRNVIERCVLLSRGSVLETRWLQLNADYDAGRPSVDGDNISFPLNGTITLEDMERRMIEEALRRHHGNVTRSAELLGISRQTMRYRIEKHHIDAEQFQHA